MLDRLLKMISSIDTMRHDDWRERMQRKNSVRANLAAAIFGIVIVGCLIVRVIS